MRRLRQSDDMLQPTEHWWHRFKLSTQKFAVLLTVGAFLAGFGYVMLTNRTASEGFAIKDLQRQLDRIEADNQKLDVQAADLRALSVVQRSTETMGLQPTDTVTYLTPTGGPVALK